jgi:tetratricopeptide (TPR) repeat protein
VLALEYGTHLSNSGQHQQAVDHSRALLAEPWFQAAGALPAARAGFILAQSLTELGEFATAREHAARSLGVLERELGEGHLEVADGRNILSGIEADRGELRRAEELEEAALRVYLDALGPGHPRTLIAQNSLAVLLKNRGRFAASAALLEQVLRAQTDVLGADHPHLASTHLNLGEARLLAGDVGGALGNYRRAVEMADANPPAHGARRGVFHAIYGRALAAAGELRQGEGELESGLAMLAEAPGPSHPLTARIAVELAAFLNDRGRHEEARRRLATAVPVLAGAYGEGSRELALAHLQQGRALLAAKPAVGRAVLRAAREALLASPYRERYAAEIAQASTLLADR